MPVKSKFFFEFIFLGVINDGLKALCNTFFISLWAPSLFWDGVDKTDLLVLLGEIILLYLASIIF